MGEISNNPKNILVLNLTLDTLMRAMAKLLRGPHTLNLGTLNLTKMIPEISGHYWFQ